MQGCMACKQSAPTVCAQVTLQMPSEVEARSKQVRLPQSAPRRSGGLYRLVNRQASTACAYGLVSTCAFAAETGRTHVSEASDANARRPSPALCGR